MSDDSFATYIEQERQALRERCLEITARRAQYNAEVDAEIADISRELAAIDAYETAKTGKKQKPARNGAVPRARRGSRREAILSALSAAPLGMTRGEILERMGLKGDKSGEMSVSNALTGLQKSGQIIRQSDGKWAIVGAEWLREAAE